MKSNVEIIVDGNIIVTHNQIATDFKLLLQTILTYGVSAISPYVNGQFTLPSQIIAYLLNNGTVVNKLTMNFTNFVNYGIFLEERYSTIDDSHATYTFNEIQIWADNLYPIADAILSTPITKESNSFVQISWSLEAEASTIFVAPPGSPYAVLQSTVPMFILILLTLPQSNFNNIDTTSPFYIDIQTYGVPNPNQINGIYHIISPGVMSCKGECCIAQAQSTQQILNVTATYNINGVEFFYLSTFATIAIVQGTYYRNCILAQVVQNV